MTNGLIVSPIYAGLQRLVDDYYTLNKQSQEIFDPFSWNPNRPNIHTYEAFERHIESFIIVRNIYEIFKPIRVFELDENSWIDREFALRDRDLWMWSLEYISKNSNRASRHLCNLFEQYCIPLQDSIDVIDKTFWEQYQEAKKNVINPTPSIPEIPSVEVKVQEYRDFINRSYERRMKVCVDEDSFNVDKELLIRDYKQNLEEIYYRFIRNKKIFLNKNSVYSNSVNDFINKSTKRDGGNITNDKVDIPWKDTPVETLNSLGMEPNSWMAYQARLVKENNTEIKDLTLHDDTNNKTTNLSENYNKQESYDLSKISWITDKITDDFSFVRIKVLDKYFVWASFL